MTGVPDPMIGQQLGQYRIIGVLGRGGMGAVYRATDVALDRQVAVKILPEELTHTDNERFQRFLREARSAAKLNHPNVVSVYQFSVQDGKYFIVMELVEGNTLVEILQRHGPIDPRRSTNIIVQACRALGAAHAAGIIHRDIKPGNIMVTKNGMVKVADFGLAKIGNMAGEITQSGDVVGTPLYMAPEQCRGEPADVRSDIYSLGMTYYRLLTGKLPFDAENTHATMYKQIHEPPPDPRTFVPQIPPNVVNILMWMLAKDPNQRPQSAAELERELLSLDFTGAGGSSGSGPAVPIIRSGEYPPLTSVGTAPAHPVPGSLQTLPVAQALPVTQAVPVAQALPVTQAVPVAQPVAQFLVYPSAVSVQPTSQPVGNEFPEHISGDANIGHGQYHPHDGPYDSSGIDGGTLHQLAGVVDQINRTGNGRGLPQRASSNSETQRFPVDSPPPLQVHPHSHPLSESYSASEPAHPRFNKTSYSQPHVPKVLHNSASPTVTLKKSTGRSIESLLPVFLLVGVIFGLTWLFLGVVTEPDTPSPMTPPAMSKPSTKPNSLSNSGGTNPDVLHAPEEAERLARDALESILARTGADPLKQADELYEKVVNPYSGTRAAEEARAYARKFREDHLQDRQAEVEFQAVLRLIETKSDLHLKLILLNEFIDNSRYADTPAGLRAKTLRDKLTEEMNSERPMKRPRPK